MDHLTRHTITVVLVPAGIVAMLVLACVVLQPLPAAASCAVPSFSPQTTFAVGPTPTSVAVGDFNGDGKLDLAVANRGDNTVSVLLGDGAGLAHRPPSPPGVSLSQSRWAISTATARPTWPSATRVTTPSRCC